MNDIIQIDRLTLVLNGQTILNEVFVSFERGKIHGIIGRNGSGKTMLMKCICGLVRATGGSVIVNGIHTERGNKVPENVGAIIETPGFLPQYSGIRNLMLLAALTGKASKADIQQAIRTVGLDPADKKPVGKYSLGMRQRLGIAQAIMEGPDLLILDEPLNGLDKQGVEEMRQLLADLRGARRTILLASHNAEDVRILCDTICEMDAGVLTKISGWA